MKVLLYRKAMQFISYVRIVNRISSSLSEAQRKVDVIAKQHDFFTSKWIE